MQLLGDCNEVTKMPELHDLTIHLVQLGAPWRHREKICFD
jgi:hypothetical protein